MATKNAAVSILASNMGEESPLFALLIFVFEKLSEVRTLTTFYLAKNDHRWVIFVSLKTIKDTSE